MNETDRLKLGELVDAREWPKITELNKKDFASQFADFMWDFLEFRRQNTDDLLTLGIVLNGALHFRPDKLAIDWLSKEPSSGRFFVVCSFLEGFWSRTLHRSPVSEELVFKLLDIAAGLNLDRSVGYGYRQVLEGLKANPQQAALSPPVQRELDRLTQANV
ncbi:MAG: hypothetical protein ACU833_08940 [Gammaproteobacteria bacterium]